MNQGLDSGEQIRRAAQADEEAVRADQAARLTTTGVEAETVRQAAIRREHEIKREIACLRAELHEVGNRKRKYWDSSLLEAERIATTAEKYQRIPLPELDKFEEAKMYHGKLSQ